ncbi:putative skeletal organic matrix protein 8 [Oculina patagonica]
MKLILKIVPLVFLLAAFPSSSAWRKRPRPTKPSWVTSKPSPSPTPSNVSINMKECSRIVDNLPQSRYYNKFFKDPRLCVRLNETELLRKLKNIGGFNPRYMAVNREDACGFQDLSGNEQPPPSQSSRFPQAKQDQPLNDQMDTEMNANELNELQDEIESLGNHNARRQKRMVPLSPGSIDRGCWSRGSIVDGTILKRLCTECAASTKLPANVFPPFINEVICGDSDGNCLGPIGKCAQKVIKFTFLRRTGKFEKDDDLSELLGVDVYVEEWDDFEQDIRSCCECRLFSFLGNRG